MAFEFDQAMIRWPADASTRENDAGNTMGNAEAVQAEFHHLGDSGASSTQMLAERVAWPLRLQPGVEARHKLHEQNFSLFSTNETYAHAAEASHTLYMLKCSMPSLWCPQCNLPQHI